MESGVLAAEVTAEAISSRRMQAADLSKYHVKWREEWGRDLQDLDASQSRPWTGS